MFNLSNSLSLLRAPLALVFLVESPTLRLMAILLAMLTDSIDGYLARRSKTTSRFGAVLDPAMDKFFVFFALAVLFSEGRIEIWEALMMVSRDFALCLFGLYLSLSGLWQTYEFRAIRWGKITTALQFFVLVGLTFGYTMPNYLYYSFVAFALFGLYELFQFKKHSSQA
ncbi:MAG: CDP-alcohol phosphatidyltransferase family protein [Rhabdochlamydiaceae bacterium]|nr:CDP-alcohol phosphatidyltransferase family protein [Rhabdochlamydiaceae bacterium]